MALFLALRRHGASPDPLSRASRHAAPRFHMPLWAQDHSVLLMDALFQINLLADLDHAVPPAERDVPWQETFELQDPVRVHAYDALESLPMPQFPPTLCARLMSGASLEHEYPDIRAACLGLLRAFPHQIPGATERVLEAVEGDPEPWIRAYCAEALPFIAKTGRLNGQGSRLVPLLHSPDDVVFAGGLLALLTADPDVDDPYAPAMMERFCGVVRKVMGRVDRSISPVTDILYPAINPDGTATPAEVAWRRLSTTIANVDTPTWHQALSIGLLAHIDEIQDQQAARDVKSGAVARRRPPTR